MSTRTDSQPPPTVVESAEAGEQAWRDAAAALRVADSDHSEFYALGGALTRTLFVIGELARVLADRVAGYGEHRRVYDDTRTDPTGAVAPQERLAQAAAELAGLRAALGAGERHANAFWSLIGHIGVEDPQ